MPEGLGHEYPLGAWKLVKLHEAVVCASERCPRTRTVVSSQTGARIENSARIFMEVLNSFLRASFSSCAARHQRHGRAERRGVSAKLMLVMPSLAACVNP